MRVTAEDRETMRAAIAPLDTEAVRDAYRAGRFPRADRVKDLDKRYRWDLFYAADLWDLTSALYGDGVNDTHLDTALRSIVAPLHPTTTKENPRP